MSRGQASRTANPNDAKRYFGKAVDYLETARLSLEKGWLSPAVGNAVHAGIAGADAICVKATGRVSQGEHDNAVEKVREVDKGVARNLHRLIQLKSRAEYDPEEPTESQAKSALQAAERIVTRAGALVAGEGTGGPNLNN